MLRPQRNVRRSFRDHGLSNVADLLNGLGRLGMAVNCHGSLPRCGSTPLKTHWSDCAIYSAPALPAAECDCGGLELADDALNSSVSPFVALPGSGGQLIEQDEANCLVEPEKLPADRFVTDATAADLPNAHCGMAFLGPAASVDLDNTHVPVVSDLKAVAALESLASDGSMHPSIPLREFGNLII